MGDEQPTWAVVELMGHVRIAGRLTEEEKFGGKMGRLDVPTFTPCVPCGGIGSMRECPICGGDGGVESYVTQYFTSASVYRITACTEEVARQIAKTSSDIAPVKPWEMPKMLLAKTGDIPFRDEDQ